jgi:hypothetical protein
MLTNLSRKEIRSKIQEIYRASKEPLPSLSKIDFSIKEFREKLKKGYTFDQFADDYPKIDLPDLTFEGEQRYDDLIKITSGTKYPKIILDMVATNKETALALTALDHQIATQDERFEQRLDELFPAEYKYKHIDESKLDWNYLLKVIPPNEKKALQVYKELYEKIKVPDYTVDHVIDLYEDEIQAYMNIFKKEEQYLQKRFQFYTEELERSYDFYEKMPTMTLKDLFEMEPELYELALDDLERKIETVGWDPSIELTPEQQKHDDLARRALGLKSLPDIPI